MSVRALRFPLCFYVARLHYCFVVATWTADRLGRLPVDVFPLILDHLPLKDRCNLARTGRKYRALHLRQLQASVSCLLRSFGLVHTEIRFMQTALSAVISGSAVSYVISNDVQPCNLDFYCPRDTYSLMCTFFLIATDYRPYYLGAAVVRSSVHEGTVQNTEWRNTKTGRSLRLIWSATDSALDCITSFPFTHLMGMITHYGFWHGYPASALNGLAMPNRSLVRLDHPSHKNAISWVVRKHQARGYKFSAERRGVHTCGTAPECPASVRTSLDSGCMNIFFPGRAFGAPSSAAAYTMAHSTSWTLDGAICHDSLRHFAGQDVLIRRVTNRACEASFFYL
jgi:hypothetical protein